MGNSFDETLFRFFKYLLTDDKKRK